jgi:hypothetical protein
LLHKLKLEASEGFQKKKMVGAKNVRDFGIATSRKFILDAMAVQLNNKTVMAISVYPKKVIHFGASTRTVAHTLKSYSAHTFDYPYPKAVSVSAEDQGMEYPMICWNYGRPDERSYERAYKKWNDWCGNSRSRTFFQ